MSRNKAQNRIECPNPEKCVIGHWDALMSRRLCFKNDVTARLMNRFVSPVLAQALHKISARQIPWQFHGEYSGESKTLVPHQMQTDGFRHRFGGIKKISLDCIRHRLAQRNPVIALRDDRLRQTFRDKASITLLDYFKNQIGHEHYLTLPSQHRKPPCP